MLYSDEILEMSGPLIMICIGDIQLVHLIESKKFEKLNGSNEWISKIVETWSQDEVHRLWEQNV